MCDVLLLESKKQAIFAARIKKNTIMDKDALIKILDKQLQINATIIEMNEELMQLLKSIKQEQPAN